MSGQWQPQETTQSDFSKVLQQFKDNISAEGRLRAMVNLLSPDEVTIATAYLENLLKTRPLYYVEEEQV